MNIKDKNFQDFLAILDEDKLTEISSRAADFTKNNHLTVESNQSYLGNSIGSISLLSAIGLLEEYHLWLMQHID